LSDNLRYPDEQYDYCQNVGRLLPQIIARILGDLGFRIWVNKEQNNGVDLKVFDEEDNLVFVAEIINWSRFSIMPEGRRSWIISNLSKFDCRRVFIYTTFFNENILDDFCSKGISLLKIGYQVLPEEYYQHYERKGETLSRRTDSEETKQDISSKIIHFLQSSGILPQ